MTYLLFAVALSLSAVAAYYAVMGLIAIFAAAVVPIAIMGSLLEVSKLTVASWLYQNWKNIPKLLKSYFTIALVVLMLLTSMGIFGFLSKAHLDQAVPTGDVSAKLSLIDEKIKTEKENLNASRAELNQLDQAVNETISRSGSSTDATGDKGIRGVERAIAIRKGQQKDRQRILSEIGTTQAKIAKLQEERAPIASEVRKVEAEVGPIKYIAAIIYDENASEEVLEKAVRIVTIMIVLVFDPLAVLMLIAANWNMKRNQESHWTEFFKKEKVSDFPDIKEKVVEEKEIVDPMDYGIDRHTVQPDPTIPEEPPQERTEPVPTESELPEIAVDEQSKDWEPELFAIRRGDVVTHSEYPDNKDVPPKTTAFLRKVIDTLKTSKPKSIEQEVDDLQKK